MPIPEFSELDSIRAILDDATGNSKTPALVCLGGPLDGYRVSQVNAFKVNTSQGVAHYRMCEVPRWEGEALWTARFWLYTGDQYVLNPEIVDPVPEELFERRVRYSDIRSTRYF
jgi:hypothetical protein